LQHQQFLVDEPSSSTGQSLGIFRDVNLLKGFADGQQIVLLQVFTGEHFDHGVAIQIQHSLHHAAHLRLVHPFGQRVDRQNPARAWFVVFHRFQAGMDQFPSAAVEPRLADQQHAVADSDPMLHPRLVEPDRPQVFVILTDECPQHAAARACIPQIDLGDHTKDAGCLVLAQLADRDQLAGVTVVAGKMEQQVRGRPQIQPLE
jgi:hypothetical protein